MVTPLNPLCVDRRAAQRGDFEAAVDDRIVLGADGELRIGQRDCGRRKHHEGVLADTAIEGDGAEVVRQRLHDQGVVTRAAFHGDGGRGELEGDGLEGAAEVLEHQFGRRSLAQTHAVVDARTRYDLIGRRDRERRADRAEIDRLQPGEPDLECVHRDRAGTHAGEADRDVVVGRARLDHQGVETTRPAVEHAAHAVARRDDEDVLVAGSADEILEAQELDAGDVAGVGVRHVPDRVLPRSAEHIHARAADERLDPRGIRRAGRGAGRQIHRHRIEQHGVVDDVAAAGTADDAARDAAAREEDEGVEPVGRTDQIRDARIAHAVEDHFVLADDQPDVVGVPADERIARAAVEADELRDARIERLRDHERLRLFIERIGQYAGGIGREQHALFEGLEQGLAAEGRHLADGRRRRLRPTGLKRPSCMTSSLTDRARETNPAPIKSGRTSNHLQAGQRAHDQRSSGVRANSPAAFDSGH